MSEPIPIVDVNKTNVAQYADSFLQDIASCDFLAMDQEMTGIQPDPEFGDAEPERAENPPEAVYRIARPVALRHCAWQLGVCCFWYPPPAVRGATAEARAYNFLLAPRTKNTVVNFETLRFLRAHGLDLNAWIDGAIPLLPTPEEATPPLKPAEGSTAPPQLSFSVLFDGLRAAQKPCVAHNSFNDWLFFLAAHRRPPGGEPPPISFSPLPSTLVEFKGAVRDVFPVVYDTKRIVNAEREPHFSPDKFPSTNLGAVYKGIERDVVVRVRPVPTMASTAAAVVAAGTDPAIAAAKSMSAAHHAAFDAYMTGVVFLAAQQKLGGAASIAKYANEIAVFGSHYAVSLDRAKPDIRLVVSSEAVVAPSAARFASLRNLVKGFVRRVGRK